MSKLPDYLGRYRLAKFIRSGNSTQIWEAIKDDGSGRCVVKVLNQQHWGNKEQLALLKHEYEVAAKLTHPNIIRIYEFNTEGNIGFLVLDVFTDLNVKQAMRDRGQAPLLVSFRTIIEQVALALQHLHQKGWVHCDVKPDNFLLNEEDELKLIDFSIAQKASKGLSALFRRRGQVRGTRSYMSPEQIRNEALDARADVYSLGCVMYELLTGRLPFTGDSPNDLLNKHLKAPVPAAVVHNDNVTPEFSEFIRQMMAKDRNERPSSMAEILKHLRSKRSFRVAPKLADAAAPDPAQEDE